MINFKRMVTQTCARCQTVQKCLEWKGNSTKPVWNRKGAAFCNSNKVIVYKNGYTFRQWRIQPAEATLIRKPEYQHNDSQVKMLNTEKYAIRTKSTSSSVLLPQASHEKVLLQALFSSPLRTEAPSSFHTKTNSKLIVLHQYRAEKYHRR